MRKIVKGNWLILLSLAFLLMLTGCGVQSDGDDTNEKSKNSDEDVIKIGVIVAETGPASTLGVSQSNSAELLQKQLDEAGPINGKKIEIIKYDYETNDTKAVIAMDKLVSEGVVAVIGATQSSTSLAMLPKSIENNIPLLTLAPTLSEEKIVYNMAHSPTIIGEPIIAYLKQNNIEKVAWLNASDGFGVTGLPAFEELAKENGIEVVAHEEFDGAATDMTIQLTKARSKNPEAIIVWSRTPGAGIVARNFKALGFDIPMIQSTAAANQGFLDQLKGDSENVFVVGSKLSVISQLPDSKQKEDLKLFHTAYVEEFDIEPDLFSAVAWDGLNLVLQAIKAGNTKSDDIQNYFQNESAKYLGITGTYDFSVSQDSPDSSGISIISIENDTWKYNE